MSSAFTQVVFSSFENNLAKLISHLASQLKVSEKDVNNAFESFGGGKKPDSRSTQSSTPCEVKKTGDKPKQDAVEAKKDVPTETKVETKPKPKLDVAVSKKDVVTAKLNKPTAKSAVEVKSEVKPEAKSAKKPAEAKKEEPKKEETKKWMDCKL
jgi:hypothetical protein